MELATIIISALSLVCAAVAAGATVTNNLMVREAKRERLREALMGIDQAAANMAPWTAGPTHLPVELPPDLRWRFRDA